MEVNSLRSWIKVARGLAPLFGLIMFGLCYKGASPLAIFA